MSATPGQVLRSVLAEAVLMGIFGTALGVLIGIPLEWYVVRVVLMDESGFVFEVLIHQLDVLRVFFGPLQVVSCQLGKVNPDLAGEDFC